MNTAALKTFAPAVRRSLMEAVGRKLDVVLAAQTPDYRITFATQVAALRTLEQTDRSGLIERVAYTWFNRLTALRYLDARGWHPFHARVLTAGTAEETQPEVLKLMRAGALPEELASYTDAERLNDLLTGHIPSYEPQGEVYRHLVLAACRYYHGLLPDLFESLDDETELLLPDDLLTEHSVAQGFRTEITDEDCADVEVLGWLYQFYISDKKSAVMARKAAVPTADIPAVTQLFTPHWIVRYLVENSLGRLWLLNRPGSRLREQMPYYIEGEPETDFLTIGTPEEIRLLDPAVGSGHMLTYAFDLLYAIYEEEGYAPSDIPGLILTHNLYGMDIDPRAAQLAQLALVLKARERSRRFFQPEALVQPHVIALENVRFDDAELREYIRALDLGSLFDVPVRQLLAQFEGATTFGSLIQPALDARGLAQLRQTIVAKDVAGQLFLSETHNKVLRVLGQAEYLIQPYHVVVANPPYMNEGSMIPSLRRFSTENYSEAKADLFAMFMQRNLRAVLPRGLVGMITMHSWMFISTYQRLRADLLRSTRFVCIAHLGARAFETISGEVVQTAAFVLQNNPGRNTSSIFQSLVEAKSAAEKETLFLHGARRFAVRQSDFAQIIGTPICYWITPTLRAAFASFPQLGECAEPRVGLQTSNNARFVRLWHEVSFDNSSLEDIGEYRSALLNGKTWFPHNKGGENLKWYGAHAFVVDWREDGRNIREDKADKLKRGLIEKKNSECWNNEFYFREGVTWTRMSSGRIRVRFSPRGFVFDTAAPTIFSSRETSTFLLGLLNSAVAQRCAEILNPTLSFQSGDLRRIPVVPQRDFFDAAIVHAIVAAYRASWDSSETSWDFVELPLLRSVLRKITLEDSWGAWNDYASAEICRVQQLETENNRRFIEVYDLQNEIVPDVPEGDVALIRADRCRDAAALLSYAVGCMMGRYSLDTPGLILADAGDSVAEYLAKVGKPAEMLAFIPDADGIIPVLDGEWFEDDIVARVHAFLRATFGEATLRENVRWLEESLGTDLRKYFLTDFYKDHLQTYKKRPIYWMVQSPKKGFSVLVYLHRYTRDTLNVVLNRYLREYQGRLRNRLAQLTQSLAGDALSARDRTVSRKEADRLTKVLHECEEWERDTLLPLAQQRIALDLDDGVKVNYLKLGNALAPIPGLAAADK